MLQKYNRRTDKWDNVLSFDKSLPLAAALHPVLNVNLIPLVDLEPADDAAAAATHPAPATPGDGDAPVDGPPAAAAAPDTSA